MRETQIPIGRLVGALGGLLLIVSLGLDWYDELSGFTSFEFLDLLLVVLALVSIAALAAALGLLRTPLRAGTELVVGVTALVVVLSQLINHPPAGVERDLETGAWLGLAGAVLMVLGAVLATARIAIAVEPRSRGAAATPPPQPPPASEEPTVRSEPPPPPPSRP
jgi:hypothetical protein